MSPTCRRQGRSSASPAGPPACRHVDDRLTFLVGRSLLYQCTRPAGRVVAMHLGTRSFRMHYDVGVLCSAARLHAWVTDTNDVVLYEYTHVHVENRSAVNTLVQVL